MSSPKPRPKRRRRARAVLLVQLGLVLLIVADDRLYPTLTHLGGRSGNGGENGLWLRYTWYFGQYSEPELRALHERLRAAQIRYAWFHVRFITHQGTLRFRYPQQARRLTSYLHQATPGVKLMAWIYDALQGGERAADLHDPRVRARMVDAARWLVRECGFGGGGCNRSAQRRGQALP